jgi:hypothetical protein
MSGRRKGLDAEREAVALLRAEGLRVFRTLRARGEPRDVDAIVLAGSFGRCVEVQIRRYAEEVPRTMVVREVAPHRVLMCREDRGPWAVWVAGVPEGDPPLRLTVATFAAWATRGML